MIYAYIALGFWCNFIASSVKALLLTVVSYLRGGGYSGFQVTGMIEGFLGGFDFCPHSFIPITWNSEYPPPPPRGSYRFRPCVSPYLRYLRRLVGIGGDDIICFACKPGEAASYADIVYS